MNLTIAEKNDIVKGVVELLVKNKKASAELRQVIKDIVSDFEFVREDELDQMVEDKVTDILDDKAFVEELDIQSVVEDVLSDSEFVDRSEVEEMIDDGLSDLTITIDR